MPPAIDQMTMAEAEQALKEILDDPRVFQSLVDHPELLEVADTISNDICQLEERMAYLRQLENLDRANNARWNRVAEKQQDN